MDFSVSRRLPRLSTFNSLCVYLPYIPYSLSVSNYNLILVFLNYVCKERGVLFLTFYWLVLLLVPAPILGLLSLLPAIPLTSYSRSTRPPLLQSYEPVCLVAMHIRVFIITFVTSKCTNLYL